LPGEREALAEARNNLEKLKAAYIEQVGNLERYRQAKDQTARELKRLEKEASPDKPEDIRSLGHLEIRLRVIVNRISDLPDNIREIENTANSILGGVNQLFNRKFGQSKEAGGRAWNNSGFAALPTRISGAVAAIETELSRK
jgi:phage-related minor tail protein